MKQYFLNIVLFGSMVLAFLACESQKEDKQPFNTASEETKSDFNPNLFFKQFGIEDGLVSSELMNVYNDNKGYTWIATRKGIVRFDGYEFKNYFTNLEQNIYLEGASYFYEDHNNNFWVLSGNGYLHKYISNLDAFEAIPTKLENGWSTENPLKILEEENGNLWLGGYGGIQFFDIKKDSISVYPVSKIRNME
jgi:ligand-binding sensor domain-containing protein